MLLSKFTSCNYFEIFAPRYRDKTVLLACHRVGEHNKIVFTKAPSLGTDPYYASAKTIKKCKKESNGSIMCYVVPLDELQPLEINERDWREI